MCRTFFPFTLRTLSFGQRLISNCHIVACTPRERIRSILWPTVRQDSSTLENRPTSPKDNNVVFWGNLIHLRHRGRLDDCEQEGSDGEGRRVSGRCLRGRRGDIYLRTPRSQLQTSQISPWTSFFAITANQLTTGRPQGRSKQPMRLSKFIDRATMCSELTEASIGTDLYHRPIVQSLSRFLVQA